MPAVLAAPREAERLANKLIAEAAKIRAYQEFCNDFSLAQHVWHAVQDDPEGNTDLVARLIHGRGFRPQLYAVMVKHNTASPTAEQLRSAYQ